MAENSKIEWTDHTFNPWIGCTKISLGCGNCYAERLNNQRKWVSEWGENGKRKRTSEPYWAKPIKWNKRQKLAEHVGHKDSDLVVPKRPKIFCASLADVFDPHPSICNLWHDDLWKLIRDTPYLNWLVLTKRPELARVDIPHNVWFGISASQQPELDMRMMNLINISAKIKFLSLEPLLGPIDLEPYKNDLDWIIVGGESGFHARPMVAEWAYDIYVQCQKHSIPYFFKQHGTWIPIASINSDDVQRITLKHRLGNKPEININGMPYLKLGKKKSDKLSRRNEGYMRQAFPVT
jgi:protein gp37